MTSLQGEKNLCNNQWEPGDGEVQKDQLVKRRVGYSLQKSSMSQTYLRFVMDSKHVRKSQLSRVTRIEMAIKMPNTYLWRATMMYYHHIRQRMKEHPKEQTHSMHVSLMVSLSHLSLCKIPKNRNKVRLSYPLVQKLRFLSWIMAETREEDKSKFKSKEETTKKAKRIFKISLVTVQDSHPYARASQIIQQPTKSR